MDKPLNPAEKEAALEQLRAIYQAKELSPKERRDSAIARFDARTHKPRTYAIRRRAD